MQSNPPPARRDGFKYCLNTSTIRGQKLSLVEEIDIAADAGYQAIEPWISEIQAYTDRGGSLPDLKKRIADRGLTVESAIGFAEWIVEDEARRAKGLEQARRDMELVQQIGGKRIAAPPAGATEIEMMDYLKVAERYRALLVVGDHIGVVPQVEVWGFSKTLTRLGQAMMVAIESGHPQACVLPDVYHLYKGGSEFTGLKLLSNSAAHVFHMNDYPAKPDRAAIKDSDRVYPGDGVAPLGEILRTLDEIGFDGCLSIELFNSAYWQQDPLTVARTALDKLKAVTPSP
jgi:sugar phosphate isomerase/epimerase